MIGSEIDRILLPSDAEEAEFDIAVRPDADGELPRHMTFGNGAVVYEYDGRAAVPLLGTDCCSPCHSKPRTTAVIRRR
ncbi:hypothetical protein ACFWOJ_31090 [Streptomyces sp. NPDC058439]|uniref:hypothetical protein n=1 Tax=Streptomyces sp. NPDC058439 TaxID=3346500 RepID=UPI00365367B3